MLRPWALPAIGTKVTDRHDRLTMPGGLQVRGGDRRPDLRVLQLADWVTALVIAVVLLIVLGLIELIGTPPATPQAKAPS